MLPRHSTSALALDSRSSAGSPRRPRLLFVAEAVSLAHVGRPAVLARWAQQTGYEVIFACGPAYADAARQQGLAVFPLPTITPRTFYGRLAEGKFFYTAAELDGYVRAELDLLGETQPDLVVGDFRLSLGVSTALAQTPLLSLCNAHWSPAAPCRFPPPRAGLCRWLPRRLRNLLFAGVRPLAFRQFAQPLDQVRQQRGLAPAGDFRQHYTAGQWCAYLDVPGWVPIRSLPPGHFFLGPVAWQPRGGAAMPLGDLGRRRPLAYVSLGSSGPQEILPNLLRSLVELGCDIALSGVAAEDAVVLERTVPHWRERGRAALLFDPSEALGRAAVTVCHGGSGTIYQSLAAGVPVLSLPDNADQGLAAAAVAAHGAGLTLEPERATSRTLQAAVVRLLNEGRFTSQARLLAETLRRNGTRNRWEQFLGAAVPQQPWRSSAAPQPVPATA